MSLLIAAFFVSPCLYVFVFMPNLHFGSGGPFEIEVCVVVRRANLRCDCPNRVCSAGGAQRTSRSAADSAPTSSI